MRTNQSVSVVWLGEQYFYYKAHNRVSDQRNRMAHEDMESRNISAQLNPIFHYCCRCRRSGGSSYCCCSCSYYLDNQEITEC